MANSIADRDFGGFKLGYFGGFRKLLQLGIINWLEHPLTLRPGKRGRSNLTLDTEVAVLLSREDEDD